MKHWTAWPAAWPVDTVTNILDPDVIVLGGGLSSIEMLYKLIPGRLAPLVFADHVRIDIRAPKWGPASGVRGAARLWPLV